MASRFCRRLLTLFLIILCTFVATGSSVAQRPQEDLVFPDVEKIEEEKAPLDFSTCLRHNVNLSLQDYHLYYQKENLFLVGLGIAGAAPVANTRADQEIRDWYQRQAKSDWADDLSEVINVAGQFWFVVPLTVEIMGMKGKLGDDYWKDGGFSEWSHRSLRAIAVGFPPVVALYGILGSGRPTADPGRSQWQPFRNINGVSGHTFMGAVPFLTAAHMTDDPFWKTTMIVGSFATGWSRIHKDRHYFSQVALGWWMAFLATHVVNIRQEEEKNWTVMPAMISDAPGVAVHVRY